MSLSLFLTVYFWLFLGFAVFFVCSPFVESFMPGKANSRDFAQVRYWLAQLLRRGFDDRKLCVIHRKSGRLLSFRKWIRRKGNYGLELRCAAPDWSDEERRSLVSRAESRGLSYQLQSRSSGGAGHNAVVIDLGQDTDAAYELAAIAWDQILELPLKAPHRIEVENWADFFERVEAPGHPPPLAEAARIWGPEYAKNRIKKAGLPSFTKTFALMALAPFMMVSAVVLPISILLSRGKAPDWVIDLESATLGGDTTSLIFFVILLTSYLAANRLDLVKPESARPFDTWEKRISVIQKAFTFSLPFAVLLVWLGF